MDVFYKQSGETLDFDFDFTAWMPSGDSIASEVITIIDSSGADMSAMVGNTFRNTPVVKQYVTGGTNGESYKVTCKITTSGGSGGASYARIKEMEIRIRIKDI